MCQDTHPILWLKDKIISVMLFYSLKPQCAEVIHLMLEPRDGVGGGGADESKSEGVGNVITTYFNLHCGWCRKVLKLLVLKLLLF